MISVPVFAETIVRAGRVVNTVGDLRYVYRNGEKILQQFKKYSPKSSETDYGVMNVTFTYGWIAVPTILEGD